VFTGSPCNISHNAISADVTFQETSFDEGVLSSSTPHYFVSALTNRKKQLKEVFPVLGILPTLPILFSEALPYGRVEAPICFPLRFGLALQASTPFEVDRI
jgi:hypothetical protein